MNRALIIRPPYINQILDDGKVWEMRTALTHIRGKIGLIEQGTGLVVGEAVLYDVGKPLESMAEAHDTYNYHHVADYELLKKWRFPWMFRDVKRYETPKPYNHLSGAVIWVKV